MLFQSYVIKHFKDSSASDFMSQNDDKVNHYVRFYFRPLTSTQLDNENLGNDRSKHRHNKTPMCPVPIFFCINLQAILEIPNLQWKISVGDMSKGLTEYDWTLDIIKRFDFSGLFHPLETERGRRSSQLEFLIENQLHLGDLPKDAITLIYQNSDAKNSFECMLEESRQIYHSEISTNYFFGKNNRIFIAHDHQQDRISVRIDGQRHRSGEILVVQIKSNHNDENIDLACQGNICAVFHCNHTTTIYGREKQLDVLIRQRNYAVYYKYQGQLWLIFTNHDKPSFDPSHLEQHLNFMPDE